MYKLRLSEKKWLYIVIQTIQNAAIKVWNLLSSHKTHKFIVRKYKQILREE